MTDELKGCPDCGTQPTIRGMKNVYGYTTSRIFECPNPDCPGIGIQGVPYPNFAHNEAQWNELKSRR